MIPAVSNPVPAPSPPSAVTAQKAATPQAPETSRASAGESGAANVRAETAQAVDAPEQSTISARLRDQETGEFDAPKIKEHTGPEPTFEESPLERQARVALDPPEADQEVAEPTFSAGEPQDVKEDEEASAGEPQLPSIQEPPAFKDPPPTPSERAEVSFTETRALAAAPEPATIDVAR